MPAPLTLELREPAGALFDEPFRMRCGAEGREALEWRARIRDDDDRVWRASGRSARDLPARWGPAKSGSGAVMALASLRPVNVDVRVEAPDGRAAARTITRLLVAAGVRRRRWREDGLAATLLLPAGQPCATVVITAEDDGVAPLLAAPLLASRGVLILALAPGGAGTAVAAARERLAAVPGASATVRTLDSGVVLPPNVGVRDEADPDAAAERARAWDALLASLGARPRLTVD